MDTPSLPGWKWEPRYFKTEAGRMHFIEAGKGPVLFLLHGCPAWSYLWRGMIPELSRSFKVIAVDMMGMGRSDKPAIDYTYFDQLNFLKEFCNSLIPEGSVFIGHDWGTTLGGSLVRSGALKPRAFGISELLMILPPEAYGERNEEVLSWKVTTQNVVMSFCDPEAGPKLVGELDAFNRVILPLLMDRKLTPEEQVAYCSPYPDAASRRALWRWPTQVPTWDPKRHPLGISGPKDVLNELMENGKWLVSAQIPKLMFTMNNGMLSPGMGRWLKANSPGVTVVDLGAGRHYGPEDHTETMTRSILDWIRNLPA